MSSEVRIEGDQQGRSQLSDAPDATMIIPVTSDDSEFVTGEALVVGGGLTAAGPSASRGPIGSREDSPFAGLVGVDRGSTGQAPIIRKKL